MSDEEISLAPQRGDDEIGTTDPEILLNNRDGSNGDNGRVSRDQITDSHDIDSASDDEDEEDFAEDDTANYQTQQGSEDPPYHGADFTPQEGEVVPSNLPDDNFQTITDIPAPAKMEASLPLEG